MELLLNLVWIATASAALVAWVAWRRSSDSDAVPKMLRGTMVVVCVLALLFPVISISDDLSQTPGLVESSRLQDVLKAPELRGIYHMAATLPAVFLLSLQPAFQPLPRQYVRAARLSLHEVFWSPSIEKRPPPQLA
jgi:hypothetical protein